MNQELKYSSPLVKNIKQEFGAKGSSVNITMRKGKDVSDFVKKISLAHKRTLKTNLFFNA